MKLKFTILSMLLAGWGLASAQDAEPTTFVCVADTWIRESAGSEKRGTADSIELGYDGSGETKKTRAGLVAFNFAVPEGMKVKTATFRIYSKLARTGQDVYVYAYPHDFTEGDACWNVEADYHNQALEQDPIAQFRMGGHGGKSIYDSGINSENQSLDKWTNDIDITDYMKSLPMGTTRINLMMKHEEMSRFYPQGCTGDEGLFPGTDNATSVPKESLAPVLILTFEEDAATVVATLTPDADTQIRLGNTADNSKATSIEIKSTSSGDAFYGLMRFVLPAEIMDTERYELTGASLRLVCVQNKGDRNMDIYSYGNDFAENTNYGLEQSYVDAALAEGQQPIASFSAAGFGTYSMGDNKADGNWNNYLTADKWTSNIDLTDHVASLIEGSTRNMNILIKKQNLHNDAMKFATREATDIVNQATNIEGIDAFTFAAADLVPQLTLTYAKKETAEPEPEEDVDIEFTPADSEDIVTMTDGNIAVETEKSEVTINFNAPEGTVAVYYKKTVTPKEETTEPEEDDTESVNSLFKAAPADYLTAIDNEDGTFGVTLNRGENGTLDLIFADEEDKAIQNTTVSYSVDFPTAVEKIEETSAEGSPIYYTLQGIKVTNPEKGTIYIKVIDGKASKVIF